MLILGVQQSESVIHMCAKSPVWLFAIPCTLNPPGSSVYGILQARKLKWVAISFSREYSWLRDWIHIYYVSCIGRQVLYHWANRGALSIYVYTHTHTHTSILLKFLFPIRLLQNTEQSYLCNLVFCLTVMLRHKGQDVSVKIQDKSGPIKGANRRWRRALLKRQWGGIQESDLEWNSCIQSKVESKLF